MRIRCQVVTHRLRYLYHAFHIRQRKIGESNVLFEELMYIKRRPQRANPYIDDEAEVDREERESDEEEEYLDSDREFWDEGEL